MFMPHGSRALGVPEQRTFQDHAMLDSNFAVRDFTRAWIGYCGGEGNLPGLTGFPPDATEKD